MPEKINKEGGAASRLMMMMMSSLDHTEGDHDDQLVLPGFRFHPTDEELVSFYLQRKIDKKLISTVELIRQIDIYKYEPWDLASTQLIELLYLFNFYDIKYYIFTCLARFSFN